MASTVSPAATRPRENVRAVVPSPTPAAPAAIGGLPILPGTGFAATGPDPFNDPDPTSGAAGGFKREFGRRMDQHRRVYHQQVDQLQHIHAEVRQVVERFMVLVGQDDQLRQVLASYDQSDTDRDVARENVASLERDLGISWGGDPDKGPRNEAALNARVLKSGMMI